MSARSFILAAAAIAVPASTIAANAALPPNYQRARELVAVVDAVAARLEQHLISEVVYLDAFAYRVIAGPCTVTATIVPVDTPGIVGPLQFEVELSEPDCAE